MSSTYRQSSAAITIDSHHHFWDLAKLDYSWMPPGPSVLRRNYLPDDLAPVLERSGVSKTVVVQAHQSLDEATWLLEMAEENDFIAGVVAWVDLTDPEVGRVLDDLGGNPKLVGIRHLVHDEPDDAWLMRDSVIRGLREVGRRGLAYDLLLGPDHLKYVSPLVEKVPGLRMVVDHIAKPHIANGSLEPWAADIAAVAAIPGVYCKVSGLVTQADHSNWNVGDLKPYVSHVAAQFGPDRLMWGSDWPVSLQAAGYDRVLDAALQALGPVSEEDKAKFLAGNAERFYRL